MGFDRPLLVQFGSFMQSCNRRRLWRFVALPFARVAIDSGTYASHVSTGCRRHAYRHGAGIAAWVTGGARPGSVWDGLARFVGVIGQSVPNFWLALIMIVVFAVNLRWFPSFGRDEWRSVLMPAFVLGLGPMGQMVRLMRSAVLEIRNDDYIRTAYGKGLPTHVVYGRHILRNAALPIISVIGVQFGYLLGGSIYIETIFSWPGIGRMISAKPSAGRRLSTGTGYRTVYQYRGDRAQHPDRHRLCPYRPKDTLWQLTTLRLANPDTRAPERARSNWGRDILRSLLARPLWACLGLALVHYPDIDGCVCTDYWHPMIRPSKICVWRKQPPVGSGGGEWSYPLGTDNLGTRPAEPDHLWAAVSR